MLSLIQSNKWINLINTNLDAKYLTDLSNQLDREYHDNTCFPPKELIFNAFNTIEIDAIKIVIIGQDPYHGEGEANGLAFSVNDGVAIPPSLKNIFIEIQNEYNSVFLPTSGNLISWAEQGVFLLNATLSVQKDVANSHKYLNWFKFTDMIIKLISEANENVVFMLWGSFAQKKSKFINKEKHLVLISGHPSPLSANRGFWFGNNHFLLANEYLISKNKKEIKWLL